MSREFPDWIDIDRGADLRCRFAGALPLVGMSRLADVLNAPEADAEVAFEIEIWRDGQGTPRIEVHVTAALPLTCQRSLRRYLEPVDSRSSLAAVREASEIARLPEDLEVTVVEHGRLRIADLVEDELVLAVPLVPRDPTLAPIEFQLLAGKRPVDEDKTAGPFAVLAGWKHNDGD